MNSVFSYAPTGTTFDAVGAICPGNEVDLDRQIGSCVLIAPDKILCIGHNFHVSSIENPVFMDMDDTVRERTIVFRRRVDNSIGTRAGGIGTYHTVRVLSYYVFRSSDITGQLSLAVATLENEVTHIAPIPVAPESVLLTHYVVGSAMTMAGWGLNGATLGGGTHPDGPMMIDDVFQSGLTTARNWNANKGFGVIGANTHDSGGPVLVTKDGVRYVVGTAATDLFGGAGASIWRYRRNTNLPGYAASATGTVRIYAARENTTSIETPDANFLLQAPIFGISASTNFGKSTSKRRDYVEFKVKEANELGDPIVPVISGIQTILFQVKASINAAVDADWGIYPSALDSNITWNNQEAMTSVVSSWRTGTFSNQPETLDLFAALTSDRVTIGIKRTDETPGGGGGDCSLLANSAVLSDDLYIDVTYLVPIIVVSSPAETPDTTTSATIVLVGNVSDPNNVGIQALTIRNDQDPGNAVEPNVDGNGDWSYIMPIIGIGTPNTFTFDAIDGNDIAAAQVVRVITRTAGRLTRRQKMSLLLGDSDASKKSRR